MQLGSMTHALFLEPKLDFDVSESLDAIFIPTEPLSQFFVLPESPGDR
jgi:hypothetical protein